MWNATKNEYDTTGKEYGKGLTPANLPEALRKFIPIPHTLTTPQLKIVMESILTQLQSIRDAVMVMPFRAISSSVLIVHEADSDDFLEEQAAMVKLIDFAHTRLTDADTADMNIVVGIDSLIDLVYTYNEYIREL